MPQSLAQLYIHLVFTTKNREPWVGPSLRPRLHAYLAEISNNFGFQAVEVGGVADHVHVLARQSRTKSIAMWVEELKTASSKWIKRLDTDHHGFAWQAGYGAFSLSPSHVEDVRVYIRNQEEHHRTVTFQEEYRRFLAKYGMEFDERYVWE